MAILPFNYYMHDDYTHGERIQYIAEQTGVDIDEELANKIGKCFYEIKLECELDTETGRVTILSATN